MFSSVLNVYSLFIRFFLFHSKVKGRRFVFILVVLFLSILSFCFWQIMRLVLKSDPYPRWSMMRGLEFSLEVFLKIKYLLLMWGLYEVWHFERISLVKRETDNFLVFCVEGFLLLMNLFYINWFFSIDLIDINTHKFSSQYSSEINDHGRFSFQTSSSLARVFGGT